MSIAYVLAPNIRYIVTSKCGVLAIGGKIVTQDALTGLPKSTFRDPFGLVANPPIMDIGSDGSPGYPVYWKVESGEALYKVTTYDGSGNMIYTEPNYPIDQSITDITVNVSVESTNYFRNEQFAFWDYGTSFDNDTLPVGSTQIATQWFFERTNLDASIEISRVVYPAGLNAVPFSPQFGLNYKVTDPAADSQSDVVQFFQSVQTLNNQQVTVGIYPKSEFIDQTPQIEVVVYQFFGTGGSTPVETVIQTINVVDSYTPQQVTFAIPGISGKTIGTQGDDYLKIIWRFNPTLVQDVTIADVQFQSGIGTGIAYPYITEEGQYTKILATQLLGVEPTQGANIVEFSKTDTEGEIVTVKQAIVNVNDSISNLLYCTYMPTNPNQCGAVVDDTTIVPNDDATYIADGVILQSNGNNIVSKDSFQGEDLTLTVVTAGKKFGIAQLVESSDLNKLIATNFFGTFASAFVRSRVTSTVSPVYKIALLGWTGAVDLPAIQLVDDWNLAGTNPSLSSGWSYIAVSDDLTLLANDDSPFVLEGVEITDAYNNVAIFCWVDSEDMLVGEQFFHKEWGINGGFVAFQPARPTLDESLSQAERVFFKTYDKNNPLAYGYDNGLESFQFENKICGPSTLQVIPPAAFPPTEPGFFLGMPRTFSTGFPSSQYFVTSVPSQIFEFHFVKKMARTPTVTVYNPSTDYPTEQTDEGFLYFGSVGPITLEAGSQSIPFTGSAVSSEKCTLISTFTSQAFQSSTSATFEGFSFNANLVIDARLGV